MPDPDPTITIVSPAAIHHNAVDHGWYEGIERLGNEISMYRGTVVEADAMTSVVTWHRYDGTPETLPVEYGVWVVGTRRGQSTTLIFHRNEKGDPVWIDGQRWLTPEIGDWWYILPEPPEGMK